MARICISTFLLTRLLRGATAVKAQYFIGWDISTHTPLARRDVFPDMTGARIYTISTHTPLARRDLIAGD